MFKKEEIDNIINMLSGAILKSFGYLGQKISSDLEPITTLNGIRIRVDLQSSSPGNTLNRAAKNRFDFGFTGNSKIVVLV